MVTLMFFYEHLFPVRDSLCGIYSLSMPTADIMWLYTVCLHTVQGVNNTPCIHTGSSTEADSVCQGTAMLWAAHLCESPSLGAIDRPLGPASTQGPICSTECVILSQQACHSSNHSNTHSFLEFWFLQASEDHQDLFICLALEWTCLFDS